MQKLIYPIFESERSVDSVKDCLLSTEAQGLKDLGAGKIQLNIRDDDVAGPFTNDAHCLEPPLVGMVSFWVLSAWARASMEAKLAGMLGQSGPLQGFAVCESEPLPNTKHPPMTGQRVNGFCQIAVIRKRPDMAREAFFDHWQNHHTELAIETQSTFRYVQNIIVHALGETMPNMPEAIVEECFPLEALNSPEVFYDAVGDPAKLEDHITRMMASCEAFLDFTAIDVIPTSEYHL